MTETEVRTIAITVPTHRLILTSISASQQPKSSQTYMLHPMSKKSRSPQMLLSLSTHPPLSTETLEHTQPLSSKHSQLPLEIIDRQLRRSEGVSRTSKTSIPNETDDAISCPSGLPQHLPLDTSNGDDFVSTMRIRETLQSSAEIEDMIHSWKSGRFNVSQSAPKRSITRPPYHPERGTTMKRVSGMKRSPLCQNFRTLDDCGTNTDTNNDNLNPLQKRPRSFIESDIENEVNDSQFNCAHFF